MMDNLVCSLLMSDHIFMFLFVILQKSFSLTFENLLGNIQGRIWLKQFGQQWSYMALSGRQVLFCQLIHSGHVTNLVIGDCYCNG